MKKIFLLPVFFCSLFLFGCNKHQFVFIESRQESESGDGFLTENDSLEIRYNFSGENIPVNITVTNKTDKPLYIDWKKSVAVIDGEKYNYWTEDAQVNLSGNSYPFLYSIYTEADGTIFKDERISYLPPRSYMSTTRIFLQTQQFENLPEKDFKRIKMQSEEGPVQVKRYHFSQENSPLVFRSIIAVSTKENFPEEQLFESTFLVSDLVESPQKNLLIPKINNGNGTPEISVISSKTNFGVAAGTVSLIGITTGLIYLSAEKGTEY